MFVSLLLFLSPALFKEKMHIQVETLLNLQRIDEDIHLKFCSFSLRRLEVSGEPSQLPGLANPNGACGITEQ